MIGWFRGNVAGRESLLLARRRQPGASRMNVNVRDVNVKGLIRSGNPVDVDRLVDPRSGRWRT